MNLKKIVDNVFMIACVDWDRRLFDSLIPLPDGTSYNSYLIQGSEKTVLIDTADPTFSSQLLESLEGIEKIDFIVSQHAEQDHSGSILVVLEKYPEAMVITSEKEKPMLLDLLHLPEEKIITVKDGETFSLGDKTLKFIDAPWVHWPETILTYLVEDKILFTCDFFGSHIATDNMFAVEEKKVHEAAKRYYAEIMMPFRKIIQGHLSKLEALDIAIIAPSHGPAHDKPAIILDAYKDWTNDATKNSVVIPYISMHGSTKKLVDRLTQGLEKKGIEVHQFNLENTDLGKLAITLVDATTIVVGVPTLRNAPHPNVAYALSVANAVTPKAKYAGILNSYGWGNQATIEAVGKAIPNLKVEVLGVVSCKGLPREVDLEAVDQLAETIASKHKELGLF